MERFNLDTWLEDKSRKVIDDDGFPVEIIKWDANEKYPVVFLNHDGIAYNVSIDGMYDNDPNHGLFFADDELTEFEKQLEMMMVSFSNGNLGSDVRKEMPKQKLHNCAHRLIDLAKNMTYNPYKVTVESIAEMVEKYKNSPNIEDFFNNVAIKCHDAIVYDKLFPKEEFVTKKQYEEDLGKAYKNADKVQFNRGMSEILNNPQKYFHVGDTIRPKNSNAEYTIASIFNGRYYGDGWSLDIMKAADDYELVEDCNEISNKIDYSSEIIGFLKNYIKTYGCTAMNSWVKWLENKCNLLKQ